MNLENEANHSHFQIAFFTPVHSNNCLVDFVANKQLFTRNASLFFRAYGLPHCGQYDRLVDIFIWQY